MRFWTYDRRGLAFDVVLSVRTMMCRWWYSVSFAYRQIYQWNVYRYRALLNGPCHFAAGMP